MNKEMLLAEFMKNGKGKEKKLFELLKVFDLANLGYEMQNEMCVDVYNDVLAKNEFFCAKDVDRTGLKVGDRITDERFMFLLSDEDFEELLRLTAPIMVERKITDEKGYFLVDWCTKKVVARKELVDFLLDEFLPKSFAADLESCRWNVVYSDKLINVLKSCIH